MACNDKPKSTFFELGEIRPARDSDFEYFMELAEGHGWTKKLDKNGLMAWSKDMGKSTVKMVKLRAPFKNISASTAFDVIMDGEYRKKWDEGSIVDYDICKLDGYNDIGYYAMRCPPPLKNRDFLNQRSWRIKSGEEYIVFNHSVAHEKEPPKKNYVRGVSYVTGFLIRATAEGSMLTYITQADPRGRVPKWAINFALYQAAPRIFRKLYAACSKYNDWKATNNPGFKPWVYPEQNTLPLMTTDEDTSSKDALLALPTEENGEDLEHAPEGMEQFETMDEKSGAEVAAAVNGLSLNAI